MNAAVAAVPVFTKSRLERRSAMNGSPFWVYTPGRRTGRTSLGPNSYFLGERSRSDFMRSAYRMVLPVYAASRPRIDVSDVSAIRRASLRGFPARIDAIRSRCSKIWPLISLPLGPTSWGPGLNSHAFSPVMMPDFGPWTYAVPFVPVKIAHTSPGTPFHWRHID